MCSLSWIRGGRSLVVVMNRDERRDRSAARPPRRWRGDDHRFTAPIDPDGGGSWIAVRDSGLVIALLNHHPPAEPASARAAASAGNGRARKPRARTSRGQLVIALAGGPGIPDTRRLRTAGLAGFAPFRLFVGGPATPPRLYTWDGKHLEARRLPPALGFVTSSSWNPRSVIAARHARFRAFARRHGGRPPRAALVAFHGEADDPRGTPWAICMSRGDARTVSTTVVEAGPSAMSMRYRAR